MFSSSQMHLHKSWGDTKFWVASSHAPYRPTAPLGGLLGTGVGGGCPRVPEGGGGLGVGFCTGGDFGDDDGGPVIAEFAYHGSKPVDPARNVIFSHLTVFQSLATCEVKQASASMHSLHKLSEGNYLPGIETEFQKPRQFISLTVTTFVSVVSNNKGVPRGERSGPILELDIVCRKTKTLEPRMTGAPSRQYLQSLHSRTTRTSQPGPRAAHQRRQQCW